MTFWQIFFRLLPHSPVKALEALYWHATRRRVRARNKLLAASASLPFVYDVWMWSVERLPALAEAAPVAIKSWPWQPSFTILLYRDSDDDSDEQLQRSVMSVERQSYPSWNLFKCLDSNPPAVTGDYVVPLRVGDTLSECALFRLAEAVQENPEADMLYGDHDEIANGRRQRPWFKPTWNSEMFLALDFVSQAVAIRSQIAEQVGINGSNFTGGQLDASLLEATERARSIVHVAHIITHVHPGAISRNRWAVVGQHIHPSGGTCVLGPFCTSKVSWPLPTDRPRVSILIPTKDKVELLKACVDSVLQKTNYGPFEIIVVDNGSVEPETLKYLDEIASHPAVSVLTYDAPYNFSAINNFAAREARGSFLCLLNNDTEVVEPEWLSEMMRYAVQPHVGAVGAKLLYDDGTIQHAGVVVGIGEAAGHAHRYTPANEPGYFRQPHVAQFVSAVTAACLVVAKDRYEAVGGLDEKHLAVAFNDVDLCLKLQDAGWKNVYVPHAVLLHYESKSRGSDFAPERVETYRFELQNLQERWGTRTYADPLHNPNLDPHSESYVIKI